MISTEIKNYRTKHANHGGKQQGEPDKVEEEEGLEYHSGYGEDLQVNVVTDAECTVHDEGDSNRPRYEGSGRFPWPEWAGGGETFRSPHRRQTSRFRDEGRR